MAFGYRENKSHKVSTLTPSTKNLRMWLAKKQTICNSQQIMANEAHFIGFGLCV